MKALVTMGVIILSGCALTPAEIAWNNCASGAPKSAQVGAAVGTVLVGPAGGLVGVAMAPDYSQRVQDCRRKLMEEAGK